jgi:GNAT superfamily N-acetyltransferase
LVVSAAEPLTNVVTYVEMRKPRRATRPWPGPTFRIERLQQPTVRFYRYLYGSVGDGWFWELRKRFTDEELAAIIRHPEVEVHLLTEGGVPAGYGEIDRRVPGEAEITYFGLMPEAVGRGLGLWFLEQITARAWRGRPNRVWLHTCDLDHPRALDNYLRGGFAIYDRREEPALDPAYEDRPVLG